MKLMIKPLLNNNVIKIISLFFGYCFWIIISQSYTAKQCHTVPLCFYNAHNQKITAPEYTNICLQAKRSILNTIDYNKLAIHIDANSLAYGKNGIHISHKELFLPSSINVVHYKPSNIIVSVEQANN